MNQIPDAMLWQIAVLVFLYMSLAFYVGWRTENNSIADVFWGAGFIVITAFSLWLAPDIDLRKIVIAVLILLWGLRLTIHIYQRNRGREEDFRYRQLRESRRHFRIRSFFQVFMVQGLFMYIVSSPVWFINSRPEEALNTTDTVGLIVFGIGFFIEAVADMQLAFWKQNPLCQGKLITTGLWRWSRHTNYFGEALVWWGVWFYTLELPLGWVTVISPVTITLMLRFGSGVPLLEKRLRQHPDWDAYARKTAPFVPFIKWL